MFGHIPKPPESPKTAVKGFTSEGYWELIHSLPAHERWHTLAQLQSDGIQRRADKLKDEIAKNAPICANLDDSRDTFLAALLLLQQNKISVNQLSTLHILDAAIRTLYTFPYFSLVFSFEKDNKHVRNGYFHIAPNNSLLPTRIRRFPFHEIIKPNDETKIEDLPERMRQPLIKRYFKFTDAEFEHFSKTMQQAPESEKQIHVLIAPEFGCFSHAISRVQKLLKCMQLLDWLVPFEDGLLTETILVIPSFTMFQAAVNAKANTLNRQPFTFVPTYHYVEEKVYDRYKFANRMPITLYLPEANPSLRYYSTYGSFRTTIDGHQLESAFAGEYHDVYHVFREMQMSDDVSFARFRLSFIAEHHPNNKKPTATRSASVILNDGELIFSHELSKDTIFQEEYRPARAEPFGAIFYCGALKPSLHETLVRAFIQDMVEHKAEWAENFKLGRHNLFPAEQKLYDEIEGKLQPTVPTVKLG